MIVLGIESSCDETAAAVIEVQNGQFKLLSNKIASQVALFQRYGGVVPEISSRAHLHDCIPIVMDALAEAQRSHQELDCIAVTAGPGLIGSLLVGVQVAKSLAFVWEKDLVGVQHLEGHLEAVFLEPEPHPNYPYLALLVSGGHTSLVYVSGELEYSILGQTRDDAAGEAFDKAAKMMGLSYPGGIAIDRLAKEGNTTAYSFPRGMAHKGLDFSFSGLKTSCRNTIETYPSPLEANVLRDICASYQEAIVDSLWIKVERAMQEKNCKELVVTGGVAANSRLRDLFQQRCHEQKWKCYLPSKSLCTDNAAMIAVAGYRRWKKGYRSEWSMNASNRLPLAQPL